MALKDGIPEGDEVTISYVDPQWPTKLRRETLKRDYGFDCECKQCIEDLEKTKST